MQRVCVVPGTHGVAAFPPPLSCPPLSLCAADGVFVFADGLSMKDNVATVTSKLLTATQSGLLCSTINENGGAHRRLWVGWVGGRVRRNCLTCVMAAAVDMQLNYLFIYLSIHPTPLNTQSSAMLQQ